MNNLFTYVNHKNLTIENLAQILPENWKNIQGLNLHSDEKLEDLSWAGHSEYGWVKLSSFDLSSYSPLPEWLDLSKNNAKNIISKARYEAETEPLTWNGHLIRVNDRTKSALVFKLFSAQSTPNYTCLWKFLNDEAVLEFSDLLDLSSFMNNYIQECFDLESEKKKEIDNCKSPNDLGQINLDINWPSTTN
jgi:hypothetical protein